MKQQAIKKKHGKYRQNDHRLCDAYTLSGNIEGNVKKTFYIVRDCRYQNLNNKY